MTTPRGAGSDADGEGAVVVGEANAQRTVLQTEAAHAEARDRADVADTSLTHPANTGGQVDLLEKRQVRDELLSLGVGLLPANGLGVHPWRGIVRR
jgi:hypothetical protein